MIEKQKSQVRQYLSESFQQPLGISSLSPSQLPQQPDQQQHHSHPGATNPLCLPQINVPNSYGHQQQNGFGLQHQQGTTPVPLMAPSQYTGPSVSPDGAAMSPSLSSVATSTSEVIFFDFTDGQDR